jgi:hypothetical protein
MESCAEMRRLSSLYLEFGTAEEYRRGCEGAAGRRPLRAADGARVSSGHNRRRALGPPPQSRTTEQSLDPRSHGQGRLP